MDKFDSFVLPAVLLTILIYKNVCAFLLGGELPPPSLLRHKIIIKNKKKHHHHHKKEDTAALEESESRPELPAPQGNGEVIHGLVIISTLIYL
jgi:hypothetical protein